MSITGEELTVGSAEKSGEDVLSSDQREHGFDSSEGAKRGLAHLAKYADRLDIDMNPIPAPSIEYFPVRRSREERATYLSAHGREEEAFERDEE